MVPPGDQTLKLLTFNCNDDKMSAAAPSGWTVAQQHSAIAALILQHDPDAVFLQECFTVPSSLPSNYEVIGESSSHRGECVLALRRDGPVRADPGRGPQLVLPSALVVPARLHGQPIYLACVHLASGDQNASLRAQQLTRLAGEVPTDAPLLVAGDTNMREHEPWASANGFADAWEQAGSAPSTQWTWDTALNRYYGPDARQYQARYDRVLLRDGAVASRGSSGFQVLAFGLAGNDPCSPGRPDHYISDHFAIVALVQLVQRAPAASQAVGRGGDASTAVCTSSSRARASHGLAIEAARQRRLSRASAPLLAYAAAGDSHVSGAAAGVGVTQQLQLQPGLLE